VTADRVHERAVGHRRPHVGQQLDVGRVDHVAVGRDDVGGEEAVSPRVLERARAVEPPRGRDLALAPAEVDAQPEPQTVGGRAGVRALPPPGRVRR
jgi:hypothetical protein